MKTEELIKGLSVDGATGAMPMAKTWGFAMLGAVIVAGVVFFMMLGPRADIGDAMGSGRFLFKFVVTGLLALTAWVAVKVLSAPGEISRGALLALLVAPALLAAAVFAEMSVVPAAERMPRMMGTNNMLCLVSIPAIGIGPLAIFLAALRHGAPTRPGMAGMVAGLLAGGIAATLYASHCFDDSPLFVVLWYTAAIAILGVIGAIGGWLAARW
jgi:hypothetical protein